MVGSDTGDSKSYWKLVTAANREDYNVASTSNPLDLSFKINNARFDTNTSGWTGDLANNAYGGNRWTKGSNESVESDWNTHNPCVERWHATTDFNQTISGLPNGKYIVKCQAFYKADNGSTHESLLYANDESSPLILKTGDGDPNNMPQASNHFSTNEYWNSVTAYVTDGTLKIGIKTEDTNNWTIWDNFQIFYCGNDVTSSITNPGFDDDSGWTDIGAVSNSETEFYDTTGGFDMYQDLTGLTAGIYAVEAQGFYRNGGGIDEKRAKANESLIALLYAKGEDDVERNTTLLSMYEEAGKVTAYGSLFGDVPNWMNQAQDFISAGYYSDNKVIVEVGTGGTLRIGAKKSGGVAADWTILDNFTLTKLNYSTLVEAYAAEWVSRKAEATALLTDATVDAGSTQRTAVTDAIALSPSNMEGYISALVTLRAAVNNFKAAKYAYALYAKNAAAATEVYNAEATTYVNVTGAEKTTFNSAYTTNVSSFSPATNNAENYYNAAIAIGDATATFTEESIKNNYNEYAAEVATAGLLGADITGVSAPATSAEALTAAHTINVINYNKVVAEEYEDVSGSTLGDWTDNNVTSRRGQHWDGTINTETGSEYFEMDAGYFNASWTMSRSQSVSLAAGKYILKVAARVSPYANATLSVTVGGNTISTISGHQGDTGKGITTAGVASYDEGTFTNGGAGHGFEWKYIPFELTETGTATLSFSAEGHANSQYVSFTSLALLTDPKVAARTALLNKINEANDVYNSGANVGTGIFQVPAAAGTTFSDAITTAQGVYDNSSATKDDITSATSTLNDAITTYQSAELNAPDGSKRYTLTLKDKGALTFKVNADTDGGYENPFMEANANLAQHFTLTQVSGNNYTLSFIDLDGNTRYICTGEKAKEGLGNERIRTTTSAADALTINISATPTANEFNMLNTASSNAKMGSNGGGLYTTNDFTTWSIAEASQAIVNVTIASDVKYGTRIFPFIPTLPEGVIAYTATVGNNVVTLTEVDELAANTPYILCAESGYSGDALTGWGTAAATSYTSDVLTGVYEETAAPADSYVLQNGADGVCFYQVESGNEPTVGANRCYLTDPSGARVLYFDMETTGVNVINALTSGKVQIFNAAGTQVPALQKGMNIIRTADGKTQKVLLK